jgi:hypothetical protein
MELGKPIRTVVVELLEAPKQQTVTTRLKESCLLPTTPTR